MDRAAWFRPWWLLASWLLLGVLPLFVGAFFFVTWQTTAWREVARRDAMENSQHLARLIDATAGVERQRLYSVGQSSSFAQRVQDGDVVAIREALRFVEADPNWQGVVVKSLDEDEQRIAVVGAEVLAEKLGSLELGAQRILPAADDMPPKLLMRVPVLLKGRVVGEIFGVYRLGLVEQALNTITEGSGTSYLLSRSGIVLAGPEGVGDESGEWLFEGGEFSPEGAGAEGSDEAPGAVGRSAGRGRTSTALLAAQENSAAVIRPALDGALRVVSLRAPVRASALFLPVAVIFAAVALFFGALVLNARVRIARSDALGQRREWELQLVYELALSATQNAERERFVRMAISRAAELLEGSSKAVVALSTFHADKVLVFESEVAAGDEGILLDTEGNSMLSRALNHGRREYGAAEKRSKDWLSLGAGAGWECWTPLVAHGRVLGALGLYWHNPIPRPMATENAVLLDSFAATLAVVLESQDRLARLSHQEAMLSTVLDASPDGIAALSASEKICLENRAFRRLFAMSEPQSGKSLDELIRDFRGEGGHLDLNYDPLELLEQAKGGVTTRGSLRISKDASSRLVESVMAPMTLPSGERGTLISLRDVSQREELDEVRRLHSQVATLAENESARAALLDKVLSASELGIVFVGNDQRVQYANELFSKLLKCPPPTRGSSFSELRRILSETTLLMEGSLESGSAILTRGAEEEVFLRLRYIPVCDEAGKIIGRLLSLRDVSEKRILEAAREDFIGVAAHELKNPVTALKLQAELAGRSDDAGRKRAVGRIVERVDELQKLVERILDVTRADLGKLQIEPEAVDLRQIVRAGVESLAAQGQVLRLSLLDNGSDYTAFADPVRTRQVLDNLLTNAVRHGGGEAVEVGVGRRGDWVFIEVSDQGPGIPKKEQERIFSRFGQGRAGRRGKGLGIGLYLAQQIAEVHGGCLELESEQGVGSKFRLLLPAFKSNSEQRSQGEHKASWGQPQSTGEAPQPEDLGP